MLGWIRSGHGMAIGMVMTWRRSAWILDFGSTEIENRGGMGLDRWVVWVMGLDRWAMWVIGQVVGLELWIRWG